MFPELLETDSEANKIMMDCCHWITGLLVDSVSCDPCRPAVYYDLCLHALQCVFSAGV